MDKRLRHIHLLRCFDAAARHESYSLAAQELSISQAAVSQQIRNLEDQLGARLFARDGRKMRLTQQGAVLAKHVATAFSEISLGFDRVRSEPEEGVLTVTSAMTFSSVWLVPRLWKFAAANPHINVRAIASVQFEDLRHSDIDVAIRQADNIETSVYRETLLVDPVYPYCSPALYDHMTLEQPSDLKKCGLIEAIDPGRFSWNQWFKQAEVEVDENRLNWIEVTTQEMGLNAVMSGHGVCLASKLMAKEFVERGQLVCPFDIPIEPGITFTLLYDQDSPKRDRIQVFCEWVKQELLLSSCQ